MFTDDAHADGQSSGIVDSRGSILNVHPLVDVADKVQQDDGPVISATKPFQPPQQSTLDIALPVSEQPAVGLINDAQQGVGAHAIDFASSDDSAKECQDVPHPVEEQPVADPVNETQQGVGAPTIDAASSDHLHQISQDVPHPVEEQPVVNNVDEAQAGGGALNPGTESQETSEQDIVHVSKTQLQQTSEQDTVDMGASEGEAKTKRRRQGGPRGCRGGVKHKHGKAEAKTETKAADVKVASQVKRQMLNKSPAQHRNGAHRQVRPQPAGQIPRRPALFPQPRAHYPSTSTVVYDRTAHVQSQTAPPRPPLMFVQRPCAMLQFGFDALASTYQRPYEHHVQDHRPADFPRYPPNTMPFRPAHAPPGKLTTHRLGFGSGSQAQFSPLATIKPTDFAVPDIVFIHSRPRQKDAVEPAQQTSQSDSRLHALQKRGEGSHTGRSRSGTVMSVP